MSLITSRANPQIKAIRALRNRRDRDAGRVFFAEGARLLQAALDYGAEVEQVLFCPDRISPAEQAIADAMAQRQVPVIDVSPDVFDSVSFREEGQAIGAVVQQRWETLTPQTSGRRCWVALHDIQHPGNLGTIIRCCDAIGGDGVILSGQSTDPYHPVAVRGTLGAIFSQRIVQTRQDDFFAWARQSGCLIVGTSPDGDVDYREPDYASRPVLLLGGNERIGISPEQIALCDALVRIPMAGYVESLNLSIATALVLYEIQRQQQK